MKTIAAYKALPIDHPESLLDMDLPIPNPKEHDLLVKVRAVSVNPADYRVRKRITEGSTVTILGWDASGVVEKTGALVAEYKPGDEVYYAGDLNRPGCNSEYQLVDARVVGRKPKTIDHAHAAAIPLTSLTAWEALFERLQLPKAGKPVGRSLLIIGGAGGVGSMAIQLAQHVPGLTVIATASRSESKQWVKDLGAHYIIDHSKDISKQLSVLGYEYVDTILCLNSPDEHWNAICKVIAPMGKICGIVPFLKAPDINLLLQKSASFIWEMMFTRTIFQTADITMQRDILNAISEMVDAGLLRSTLKQIIGQINADNLKKAHSQLESNRTIGKLVLEGFNSRSINH